MECGERSPSHYPQCPAASAMGRRTVEVTNEESSNERVEWTMGVKTSEPKVTFQLSSCFCEDTDACVCKSVILDSPPPPLCLSPATAAAQTQMPSTKPKAGALVARRQLTDGREAASLREQSTLPSLTLKGTVRLASTDPRTTSSVHAYITRKASISAAQHESQRSNRNPYITTEDNKMQYYRDLCLQVEERKQQMKRERSRNATDEQKHNDTMQRTIWGMPGSGAPNFPMGTVRRTNSLHAAGILPQEQIRDTVFSGTPFRRL
ncbi:uncharacterized protein LOC129111012 [Anoplopoma fimbria]|uniref:uncharacterized protein LOC129111012 n=1 Tax=Anoplopoma fimbria TaxID=229290 RepID=UPI0023EB271B|nr:uncharacterized protein LOC129111012 [Anoplopoma fimbria]